MSRVTIYGNKKDRKAVLEFLQRRKIMDISEGEDDNSALGFRNMNTGASQAEFAREQGIGERALDILNEYSPEKKGMTDSLNGRKTLSEEEYYKNVSSIPETLNDAKKITELSDEIAKRKGSITACSAAIEELEPWTKLDVPMNYKGSEKTSCLIGAVREEAEGVTEKYYANEKAPPIHIEVINHIPQQTLIFALCAKASEKECEERLREIGFSKPRITCDKIPREEIEEQRRMIDALEKEIAALEGEIKSYANSREKLKFLIDYYAMRAEKYSVLGKLSQRNSIFVIYGYIPESEAVEFSQKLEEKYHAAVEIEKADENAPVLLKNAYLAEPVEGIVKTFALPTAHEIDPTSIMAIFYYVFFGLMLSDAAYGFIMFLGCAIALMKFKNMEQSMRKTLRMFMYCGISTMFWGVMFGSYFGDAVEAISGTFFGKAVTIPPLWFEPVNDPMKMLMVSFLFGIIHLFTGLGIKLWQCIKNKDYMAAFVDCICWYMLVGGGVVYLFSVDMFLTMAGLSVKLPAWAANIAAVIAIIGAVGILFFTASRDKWGKRLAKGAYSLYGITSWLSDILSYSRLLALGLATGVIATVFNKIGTMFGGGIVGALIFIVVFLIGHTLNIGINLLGAYVHTNRLQFVEFFGKFYEGGGREFEPFAAHTKYYKFNEEYGERSTK